MKKEATETKTIGYNIINGHVVFCAARRIEGKEVKCETTKKLRS